MEMISYRLLVSRLNQIRVAPVLRFEPQANDGYRVGGWLPSELWRDRVAALLVTCAPRQGFSTAGIQVDPTVLDPAYLDQASLPSFLTVSLQQASFSQCSQVLPSLAALAALAQQSPA